MDADEFGSRFYPFGIQRGDHYDQLIGVFECSGGGWHPAMLLGVTYVINPSHHQDPSFARAVMTSQWDQLRAFQKEHGMGLPDLEPMPWRALGEGPAPPP